MVLSMVGLWVMALHRQHNALLAEKHVKELALAEMKAKSRPTEILQKTYNTLLDQARFLEQQSEKKFTPVDLLDSISRSVNPLSLWLLRLEVDETNVEIQGRGLRGRDIQSFVDSLERTTFWEKLLAIEMDKESYQGVPVYRFGLRFTIKG